MSLITCPKYYFQELHIGEQDMTDVLVQCLNLQKVRKGHGGPIKPRIILIGPRGSGRKTQAKLLMETNDIVHGVYCKRQIKPSYLKCCCS